MALRVGKLPAELLARMLGMCRDDPRVVVRPGIGLDAAALAFGDKLVVVKSDPITFATDQIGWYAVNINANDVACLGARPRFFLATVLLPEGRTDEALVETIFADLAASCEELDVTLCGGHTEITYGLDRPIVVGHMVGEAEPERLVRNERARPGDEVLLTKGIAIEGTALLAREKADELAGRLPHEALERARGFLREPGLSVVPDAMAVCGAVLPHALHDPTEGGLATGLHELADAAGCVAASRSKWGKCPFSRKRGWSATTTASTPSGCSPRARFWSSRRLRTATRRSRPSRPQGWRRGALGAWLTAERG